MVPVIAKAVLKDNPKPVALLNACAREKNVSIELTGMSRNVVPSGGGERR